MANALARRLSGLGRNSLLLRDLQQSFSLNSRCSSVFFVKLDCNSNQQRRTTLFQDKLRYIKSPIYSTHLNHVNIQHFSKSCKDEEDGEKKLSIFQRFKKMYKEYWYVLVPVHLVTSAAWFGGFYYLAKSGVDVAAILESMHISEKIVNPLRDSSMGYIAVAYALYKIMTPLRYTVTLGGTTVSINYLKKWGYIKPIPSKERLKEMYQEKKEDLFESFKETKEELKSKTEKIEEKIKDKKENVIDDFSNSIKQIKRLGDKIKTKDHVVEEIKKQVKKEKE